MRQSLKGKTFTGDINKDYVKRTGVKFQHNHSKSAESMFPIVTEERVKTAIDILKKIRNKK